MAQRRFYNSLLSERLRYTAFLLLMGIGFIFRFAAVSPWLKVMPLPLPLPFVAVSADILAWFLTQWNPFYAYTEENPI
ncbi:hypothetical protein [Sedimenticola selenatireducens]|uniref:hypothetical protein n=1 Tax=Sedimenticola selenatireducens TaxID=191960 RepID=UPI00048D1304|nr:hypothetical protein [Sedimenticola selenatireducens]